MFSLCFLSFSLFLFYTLFSFLSFSHTILAEHTPLFLLTAVTLKCTAFNNQRKCVRVCGCVRARKCEGVRAWVREWVWGRERERDVPFKAQSEFYWSGIREVCFMFLFNTNGKKFRQQKKFQNKNWNKKMLPKEKNGFRGNDKFSAKFFAFGLRPVVGIINFDWW